MANSSQMTLKEALGNIQALNDSLNAYKERVDVNIDAFFLVTMSVVVYRKFSAYSKNSIIEASLAVTNNNCIYFLVTRLGA